MVLACNRLLRDAFPLHALSLYSTHGQRSDEAFGSQGQRHGPRSPENQGTLACQEGTVDQRKPSSKPAESGTAPGLSENRPLRRLLQFRAAGVRPTGMKQASAGFSVICGRRSVAMRPITDLSLLREGTNSVFPGAVASAVPSPGGAACRPEARSPRWSRQRPASRVNRVVLRNARADRLRAPRQKEKAPGSCRSEIERGLPPCRGTAERQATTERPVASMSSFPGRSASSRIRQELWGFCRVKR